MAFSWSTDKKRLTGSRLICREGSRKLHFMWRMPSALNFFNGIKINLATDYAGDCRTCCPFKVCIGSCWLKMRMFFVWLCSFCHELVFIGSLFLLLYHIVWSNVSKKTIYLLRSIYKFFSPGLRDTSWHGQVNTLYRAGSGNRFSPAGESHNEHIGRNFLQFSFSVTGPLKAIMEEKEIGNE